MAQGSSKAIREWRKEGRKERGEGSWLRAKGRRPKAKGKPTSWTKGRFSVWYYELRFERRMYAVCFTNEA